MSLLRTFAIASSFSLTLFATASSDSTVSDTTTFDVQALLDSLQGGYVDSVEASYIYQHGDIPLENGVATLKVPAGFKYLDPAQSSRVIVDLWGNPNAEGILGIILPEDDGVLTEGSYAFVVQYDEVGYVKDSDADEINYEELLKQLQEDEVAENQMRADMGYDPAYTVGWAAEPFYDKENKVLHWAKEIQFGDSAEANTLNYNVRVLGRKGVLVLNAVAGMGELALVQQHIPEVLGIVHYNDGHRYEQFDSSVDEVAAWTIGGLVAGKVLAKVGLFALLAKNIKLVIIGLIAAGGAVWGFISRRKKKEEGPMPPATNA